jgi:hypothetical protein
MKKPDPSETLDARRPGGDLPCGPPKGSTKRSDQAGTLPARLRGVFGAHADHRRFRYVNGVGKAADWKAARLAAGKISGFRLWRAGCADPSHPVPR